MRGTIVAVIVTIALLAEGHARPRPPTGPPDHAASARFKVGDRVRCNWRGHRTLYPGAVGDAHRGYLFIKYDDGGREWISPRLCRRTSAGLFRGESEEQRRTHRVSGGRPTGFRSRRFAAGFGVGNRVRCAWRAGRREYLGRVGAIDRGYLLVNYDDGGKEWISPVLCVRGDRPLASRYAKYRKGGWLGLGDWLCCNPKGPIKGMERSNQIRFARLLGFYTKPGAGSKKTHELYVKLERGGERIARVNRCTLATACEGPTPPPVDLQATMAPPGAQNPANTGTPDEEEAKRFRHNNRVKCKWQGRKESFAGRVRGYSHRRSGMLDVTYDFGARERISPTLCQHFESPSSSPPHGRIGLGFGVISGYDLSVEDAFSGQIPTTLVFTPMYHVNRWLSLEVDIRLPLEVRDFAAVEGVAITPGIGLSFGGTVMFRFGGKLYFEHQYQKDSAVGPVDLGFHVDLGLEVTIVRWLGLYARGGISGAFLRNVNFIFDGGGGVALRWP